MAKKKAITQKHIIDFYMDYVLSENSDPKSVYAFAKLNNFEEQEFYKYFGSFKAVREAIFTTFHKHTMTLLNKSSDFKNYDARNKLLSYYYTLFEMLNANRSYVVYVLHEHKNQLKSLEALRPFKADFSDFINSLQIDTLSFNNEKLDQVKERGLRETAWFQFLVTLKFWLEDSSPSFEKTDIFIEKSVQASFDVIDVSPLKSLIDFGKFIYKEKVNLN